MINSVLDVNTMEEFIKKCKTRGQYKLEYTLNKVLTELVVKVELRQRNGLVASNQNVYEGVATVNDLPYKDEDLSGCVNAMHCAEGIGIKLKNEYKAKAKADGKSFRIKTEEIK